MGAPAVAIIGLGLSAIGTGLSFTQAAKQRRLAQQAADEAEVAINNARVIASKNVAEQAQIPMQAYEQGFRQRQVLQKDIMNSLQGADTRSLAAGVGGVAQAGMQAQQRQQATQEQALAERQNAIIEGEQERDKALLGLETAQGTGAMQAAAQASNASTRALQSGAKTLAKGLQTAYSDEGINPLYGKSLGDVSKGEYSGAVERYTQAAIDSGKIRPDQRDAFMAHLATDVSEGGADIESNAAVRGLLRDEDFSIVDSYVQGVNFQDASEAAVIDTTAPAALDFNEIPGLGGEIPQPIYNT
jgi:ribosomal 50S subunit-recycling heat shock protein